MIRSEYEVAVERCDLDGPAGHVPGVDAAEARVGGRRDTHRRREGVRRPAVDHVHRPDAALVVSSDREIVQAIAGDVARGERPADAGGGRPVDQEEGGGGRRQVERAGRCRPAVDHVHRAGAGRADDDLPIPVTVEIARGERGAELCAGRCTRDGQDGVGRREGLPVREPAQEQIDRAGTAVGARRPYDQVPIRDGVVGLASRDVAGGGRMPEAIPGGGAGQLRLGRSERNLPAPDQPSEVDVDTAGLALPSRRTDDEVAAIVSGVDIPAVERKASL